MAEIRFSCQSCHQHITCDEAWAGHQIQCPICSKTITVPPKVSATQTRPAAPAPGAAPAAPSSLVPKVPEATKLSFQQNAQQPAVPQKSIPIRNFTAPPKKKEGPWKSIGIMAAIILILGGGGYFGWPYISKMFNKEAASKGDAPTPSPEKQAEAAAAPVSVPPPEAPPAPDGTQASSTVSAPTNVVQTGVVIPAVHTLEIASARIPSGRVNGKISRNDFLPDTIRIDPVGATQVLRFSEGDLMSPDRELLVYLRLKPGDKLEGQKINISQDMRTSGLPQISKRWKTNPKYAPTMRSFSSGYVMKLELNQHAGGTVKGKVYIALPDPELTVVAGNFTAVTPIPPEGVAAPTALPTATPAQPAMPTGPDQAEFQRRYGQPVRR